MIKAPSSLQLCPRRRVSSIIHRDRRFRKNGYLDLPTCLRLAQSACVFDVTALLLSFAFHESICDVYQVVDGLCVGLELVNVLPSQET